MKNQSILILAGLIAIVVASIVVYSLHNKSKDYSARMHMNTEGNLLSGMHRMPDGSLMRNESNSSHSGMGGTDHSMMMIKSEREFLEGMIPHHLEAVVTAKDVIARGGSTPEIKKLAENIVSAQEKEIAMMKDWYQSWYGEEYVAESGDYQPMMRDLSTLSGSALDKVFLEDMILHHMGAVMMAQSVERYIEHQEIIDLTKAIVETQTAEIQLMRSMLSEFK